MYLLYFIFLFVEFGSILYTFNNLTFEERTELSKCANWAATGELSNGKLHVKQWHTAYYEYYKVGNQEDTCN